MIIFNASTLILLAKAELLGRFLEEIDFEAAIPKAVERECWGAKKSLDALFVQKAIAERRVQVMAVRNQKLSEKLRKDFLLSKGEAEAIALALSEKARLLATDDQHGIHAGKLLGIPFTTAINVLIRMREKKLLGEEEALRKLEALERYGRYKAEIIQEAAAKLVES